MGGKGGQTTTTAQNQSQTYAPAGAGWLTGALNQASNAASLPFNLPVAPVAGFNPTQQAAFNNINNAQGSATPYLNQAAQYFTQGTTPNVSQFFNPYAGAVTAQMNNIFGQQQSQNTGSLVNAAGGVGADRVAVGQANLANQQGLAAGQTLASLYAPALGAAQGQENILQGAGYGMAGLGAQTQNLALQGAQAQLGAGGLQQQLAQAQLNAPYQWQVAQSQFPYQQANFLANITGALAPGLGGQTTGQSYGQTTQPPPSMFSQILGGAGLGVAALGGSGAFGNNGYLAGANPFSGSPAYGGGNMFSGDAYGGNASNPLPGLSASDYGSARGGAIGYDNGGGVSDEPIDITKAGAIPTAQIAHAQAPMPQLNMNAAPQVQSSGGGKGSATQAIGDVAKIATMFAATGGAVPHEKMRTFDGHNPYAFFARGGYADGGGPDNSSPLDTAQWPFGPVRGPSDVVNPDEPLRMPDAASVGAWRQGADSDRALGLTAQPAGAPALPTPITRGAPLPGSASPGGLQGQVQPSTSGAPTASPSSGGGKGSGDFLSSPWAALAAASLGVMGGTSPFAAVNIGQGGMQGLKMLQAQKETEQKEETIQQAAKRLQLEQQFHEDQFTRTTPYQQFEMHKPVAIGQRLDPTTGMPMTTYGTMQPDGSIKPIEPAKSMNDPDADLPKNATPTQGFLPGVNVPETVNPTALEGVDNGIANMVRAIDEGRQKLSEVPMRQRYMVEKMLHDYDPGFDETTWGLRNKQMSDLSTNGNAGKMILATNQLLPHLKTLSDQALALHSTGYPAANTIRNWWLTETGDPRVKKFEEVREVASTDAARLLRGSGQMAEKDIEFWRNNLASAGSPQALQEQIALLSNDLMGARLSSIEQSYRMNMRMKPPEFRSPEAIAALQGIEKNGKIYSGGGAPAAAETGTGGAGAPAAPAATRPDPAVRFQQLTAGGLSKEQAYAKMHQEGY